MDNKTTIIKGLILKDIDNSNVVVDGLIIESFNIERIRREIFNYLVTRKKVNVDTLTQLTGVSNSTAFKMLNDYNLSLKQRKRKKNYKHYENI